MHQLNGGVGGGFVLLGVPVVDGGVVVGTDVVGLRGICGCIVADAGETEVAPEDGVGGQGHSVRCSPPPHGLIQAQ